MEEYYKPIENSEDSYFVSNFGNVKSKDRFITYSDDRVQCHKGKLLKPRVKDNGYLVVVIKKNNKLTTQYVHRLVAQHFIDNPNNFTYVLHLDNNKENNAVTNLKWGTQSENIQQAISDGLRTYSKGFSACNSKYSIEIYYKILELKALKIKVKDICFQLNIPLRSYYNIIRAAITY